jgi:hypothetical protein
VESDIQASGYDEWVNLTNSREIEAADELPLEADPSRDDMGKCHERQLLIETWRCGSGPDFS